MDSVEVSSGGALDAEYFEVARRLVRPAQALTGSGPVAEDLVFDTMAALAPRWHRISGDKVAYARRSMANRFTDQWRRDKAAITHLTAIGHSRPASTSSHDDAVGARLDVQSALNSLDERARLVLTLRYLVDLSAVEIARMLDLPAGTVRRISHDGLALLRARLSTEDLT